MHNERQIMAGYVRLSKEDEEKQLESESVQNQKALLTSYAEERGWKLHDIYVDEDYSGVDSMRPEFNRLLADAEKHKFNIVVCKSQSRFTRDMEAVEKYIHHKFLLWNIRFISITDNADTAVKGNKKARQINGLINEWYLEDLSENVRTVLEHKRKTGQFIGSFATYGYQKDPENRGRLIPDPVAAETVRLIYQLYLQGMGQTQIAQYLNERGIANPATYKKLNHDKYSNANHGFTSEVWSRTSVNRILREQMYTGDLVQGRKKKLSYKSSKLISVPKSEWIVVQDVHEPIIDRETYELAQEIRLQRTFPSRDGKQMVHVLSGKVRCMDCGGSMNKYRMTYKEKHTYYLRCKLYGLDKSKCTGHSIRVDRVEQEIARLLREHISAFHERKEAAEYLQADRFQQKRQVMLQEIKTLNSDIERRRTAVREIYLDKASGIITAQQFVEYSQGYQQEADRMEARASSLQAELETLEGEMEDMVALQRRIDKWLDFQELNRELVLEFVDYVEIGEKDPITKEQEIRIHWLF